MHFSRPNSVKYLCAQLRTAGHVMLLAICVASLSGLSFGQRSVKRSPVLTRGEVESRDSAQGVNAFTQPTFFESFSGNPTCADIAARYPADNVVEPSGLKLAFSGVYSDTFFFDNYVSPYGNVFIFPPNSLPTNPVQTITVTTSGVNSITSFVSQKPITAVMIKAGNEANIWYYDVPGIGHTFDGGNLTAINPQGTSHIQFCYEAIVVPSAAAVSISGRAYNSEGRGITNAKITLTDGRGEARTVVTGRSGRYVFDDVESGESYVLSIASRRFSFDNPSMIITPNDNLADVDFRASW